ncbi:chromosome partition protein Smc-like [Pararge aegeria]|uniref:chromosome partition protein Smc-like n=1 Tax=Pararge aegeria TaxID=116150 RepID=UPI0019D21BC9|nr:chromosome partition protein Smc-like [Pararge aegeria]
MDIGHWAATFYECPLHALRRVVLFIGNDLPIPDNEEDEEDTDGELPGSSQSIDTRKLVQDISRELKKTFKEEIGNLEASLDFLSDQISSMEQTLKLQDSAIKNLEHKNDDLRNKNKNLELRVNVLEQGLKAFEQKSLSMAVEIAGIPEMSSKDVDKLVRTMALKLSVPEEEFQSAQRLPGSKNKPGPILVNMKSKIARNQLMEASKDKNLTVGMLLLNAPKEKVDNRVYIREALTKYVKTLLYNAKTQLRSSFQFIWCKDGKVCVRKSSDSKIHYIRSDQDIRQLLAI